MVDTTSSPAIHADSEEQGIHRLPPELLPEVFINIGITDFPRLMLVCKLWRAHILPLPRLWTNLDLTRMPDCASGILPAVLPRSGQLPLSISCVFTHSFEMHRLCEVLKPVLYRVQHLALLCSAREDYMHIFSHFLPAPAPILRSLDVSTGSTAPCGSIFDSFPQYQQQFHAPNTVTLTAIRIPGKLLGNVPGQLREVNCGSHFLPAGPCPALSVVTSVRLNIGVYNRCTLRRACAVFPSMTALEVLNCCDADAVGRIPDGHLLRSVRLVSREDTDTISWADLVNGGYTRLPILHLEHFPPKVAESAVTDLEWTVRTLELDDGGSSTVTLVSASKNSICHIFQQRAQDLLALAPLMHNIVELTISLASGTSPIPNLTVPCVQVLTISGALDVDVVRRCGLLTAPKLRVIRIAGLDVLNSHALAKFISKHIQHTNTARPVLALQPQVLLGADADGLAALHHMVSVIEVGR